MESGDTVDKTTGAAPGEQDKPHRTPPDVKLLAQRPLLSKTPPSTRRHGHGEAQRSFYSSAQWTADGTTVVVGSSDNTVSSIVLPADLLQYPHRELQLEPQSTTKLPEPTQVIATAPFFSLAESSTQTYLVGCRDHPLHLNHAFPSHEHPAPLAAYKLIKAETEAFITPASLLWHGSGSHFLCGSANRLDYFDVSRHGSDGPVLAVPTIPSRRHIAKGSGVGMKGTVAALAAPSQDANNQTLVAAGTRTRWIGLYDLHRTNHAVANWGIAHAGKVNADFDFDHYGQGIVQLVWSLCGRYLIVNERQSSNLLIYDIRGSGKLLAALSGRKAKSQQRLACDVYQGDTGGNAAFEVWAGSDDGSVLVWEDVGNQLGLVRPSWSWKAHDSPVGSMTLHSCGSVAATCSGAWEHASDRAVENFGTGRQPCGGSRTLDESSLKIWSIGTQESSSY
ncbi:hypothetical protein HRG_001984 [Hirsutella rhossiliensis]|uniref:WD repeat-containing protein 79 n=1 Tax=Hirsutella rhossiliensis TaxID=111463 RepID=A0A9P8SM85_9HYPO|nr:uncharacterized protein HRG_01984 [Hirsutella rhossiliensis]KAH0966575.1 hypothetical protein HRG_01984 [Hirsutella rhossiliensis]